MWHRRAIACLITVSGLVTGAAHASLTFLPGAPALSHVGNLVTNGSFEIGAPAFGTQVPWASPITPGYSVPAGWSSSGVNGSTYATWGSGGIPGQGIRGSAPLPDGQSGMYFGNLFTDVSPTPNFLANGRVTFPSPPIFTPAFGGTCELSQTINTHLTPAPAYRMSFWVSGEDAAVAGNTWTPGIMGLRFTNVLAGNPIQFLSIPGATGGPNNRVYTFEFVPLNSSLPVGVTFINWGHVTTIAGSNAGFSTELVLDDVIVNTVPTPSGAAVLGVAGVVAARRRRACAH